MSGRNVQQDGDSSGAERRQADGCRVHFEAMVAVGGAEGGAGFEAESLDVSSDGMRFRTAYLPTVGDQLVCRFDGNAGEIIALGEVVWTTEQTRGGEFGLRFVDVDEETAAQLREMCQPAGGHASDAEREPSAEPQKVLGSRVRLHIEGLGSPMKARVRDADKRQMSVGSNLEFLKLGRSVEIEDVDAGQRKEGFVDGVRVEVDPQTSVPQLVVSLRFDAAALVAGLATAKTEMAEPTCAEPKVAKTREPELSPAPKTKPAKSRITEPKKLVAKPKSEQADAEAVSASEGDSDDEIDEQALGLRNPKLRAVGEKATEMSQKAMAAVGPALSSVGRGAKNAFGKLRGAFDKRREQRAERVKANSPRRVTAPPPSGVLTSAGRRVVREQDDEQEEEVDETPKPRSRRGLMMGAGAGLLVVLSLFGIARAVGGDDAPAPLALTQGQNAAAPPQLPPIPGAAATADIPLFGATPLSTTEQVPVTAPSGGSESASAEPSAEEEPADDKNKKLTREWGEGEVENPRVLKIRMDGPIDGFIASEVEGGFNIVVPGRKSLSTSSSLVRKDKRLSAVDVITREDATEISVRFKGEAPAFLTKVRSDRIEIALSGDKKKSDKKVASKSKKDTKKPKKDTKKTKK